MSDLYGAFAAAASRGEELDPARRELLVEVIGRSASRRRRRRNLVNAAASVGAVVLVGGGMTAAAGMWGPADGTAGPAVGTSASIASPTASPSPSDTETLPDPVWGLAGPGWFLVEYQTLEVDSQFLLVAPDGETHMTTLPLEYSGGRIVAWLGGESLVPTSPSGLGESPTRTDTIVGVVSQRTTVHSTPLDGAELIQVATDRDLRSDNPSCITGDAYGEALLTPDKTGLVCFEPVSDEATTLVLAPTTGPGNAEVLAEFSFPASDYARIGWVNDSTLLFGRELDKGYRYFTFDFETEAVADVFLPGDLDGWVPTYDRASRTFRLVSQGKVEFFEEDGEPITTIHCETDFGLPQAWVSGDTALVACPGVGASRWDLLIVDLATGATTLAISLADSDGEDALAGVFPYRSDAG